MIFALLMLAAAIAATAVISVFGGVWAGALFAAALVVLYRAANYTFGPERPMRAATLNAFQRPLAASDDREVSATSSIPEADIRPTPTTRGGYRNKAYRKHFRRKSRG